MTHVGNSPWKSHAWGESGLVVREGGASTEFTRSPSTARALPNLVEIISLKQVRGKMTAFHVLCGRNVSERASCGELVFPLQTGRAAHRRCEGIRIEFAIRVLGYLGIRCSVVEVEDLREIGVDGWQFLGWGGHGAIQPKNVRWILDRVGCN